MERFKKLLFLTLGLFIFSFQVNVSCEEINPVINQVSMKDNLRLEIYIPKDALLVQKTGNFLTLAILKSPYFDVLSKKIESIQINKQYIKGLKLKKPQNPSDVPSIEFELLGDQVEIFSFYRENESKQIIDFWINPDFIPKQVEIKPELPKPERKIATEEKKEEKKKVNSPKKFLRPKAPDSKYRDFRYGAAFVWDYPPFISPSPKLIDFESKSPDYFYPIRDLKIMDSEKLAHLQLSINLFKKSQFGLMNKSIDLYFKKYGEQADLDLNEFLKANAILKLNKGDLNKESSRFALNMLNIISKRTSDYALKKGILRYLVAVVLNQEDYINTIKEAKRLFDLAKEYSDTEVKMNLSSVILYSLAKLGQIEKIVEILKHPDYAGIIPPQLGLSFQTYILLSQDKTQEVIGLFEKSKKSLVDPIHEGILFNVAESYFREGNYAQALEIYEKFLKSYSYHINSAMVKMRIALIKDLQSRDPEQVIASYRAVIDSTADFPINYEARLRYVAFRCLRNKAPQRDDIESRALLKLKENEEKILTDDLKKLLWMVRLRTFIVDGNYSDALTYLTAIPNESLKPFEKMAFDGDGAEIVFGLIQEHFRKEEFPDLIKTYEMYSKKYEKKIGREPILKYIVGKAYLQLGTYDLFDEHYKEFKLLQSTNREFPIWIERVELRSSDFLMLDLAINKNIKLENFQMSQKLLDELKASYPQNDKALYFQSIINFKNGKFKEAIENVEKFLSTQKSTGSLEPSEIVNILQTYTEAIYKIGDLYKYKKVSNALLEDTKSESENPQYKVLKERILYLNIEILVNEQQKDKEVQIETDIKTFMDLFPNSKYKERVSFLLGQIYIEQNRFEDGEKIMRGLLESSTTPNYLKELARTELSFITIKNKSI